MFQSLDTSLKDLGNGKVQQMELDDAEKEVYRLEQEARIALEENKRYCKALSTQKKVYIYILSHYFMHVCSFSTSESEMSHRVFQLSKAQRTVTRRVSLKTTLLDLIE